MRWTEFVPGLEAFSRQGLTPQLLEALLTFGLWLLVLLVLRHLLWMWFRRRTTPQQTYAAMFRRILRLPSLLWCLAGSLALTVTLADLTSRQQQRVMTWIVVFVIASVTLALAAIAAGAVRLYGKSQEAPLAVAGLSRTLVYIFVLGIGAMTLMNYLGLSLAPLLTAVGLIGAGIALAFRDELANIVAGVFVLMETPYEVGDFIQLGSGEEGTVTDIGWRSTRLLTSTKNVVIVPNSRLTSTTLTNFHLPARAMALEIPVLAGQTADPRAVMRVALEAARGVDGVLEDPAPLVRFQPGYTITHIQCNLVVHIGDRTQKGPVQSEVNLRLVERFRREGIPLPDVDAIRALKI